MTSENGGLHDVGPDLSVGGGASNLRQGMETSIKGKQTFHQISAKTNLVNHHFESKSKLFLPCVFSDSCLCYTVGSPSLDNLISDMIAPG